MLHLVLRRWLLVAGLCLLAAPAVWAADSPTAEWHIQAKEKFGKDPVIEIDLVINDQQTVNIEPAKTMGGASVVARSRYADCGIPVNALCACCSYYANSGTNYYVAATGKGRLALYRRTYDEDGTTRFKKVRTIKVEPR